MKLKTEFLGLILSFLLINQYAYSQQVLGKWIVPSYTAGGRLTNELVFFNDGTIGVNSNLEHSLADYVEFSGGGYNVNYDAEFYVLGESFCYGTTTFDWVNTAAPKLQPEFQIINIPGEVNKYYSFFTGDNIADRETDYHFCYNEIDATGTTVTPSLKTSIRGGLTEYVGFAITEEDNGSRFLFVSTGRNTDPDGNHLAGIRRWTITNNGIDNEIVIIDESNSSLDQYDFDAYNFEHKYYDNGTGEIDVFAWIHGVDDMNINADVSELVVVNDGVVSKYNFSGRLGGIEFSQYEGNIIYVSSSTDGLLKVDYTNGQIIETLSSTDFGRTFLQTAPDGHIYGVSNDGTKLGRIYQYDQGTHVAGYFLETAFQFPQYSSVSSVKEFSTGTPYYILPENQRTHNFMTLSVETTPTCPGYSEGTATITIEGGFMPYTLILTMPDGTTQGPVTVSDQFYTFENLGYGSHSCEVTDNYGNSDVINFFIEYIPFDVENNLYEVDASETWSNISGRSYLYGIRIKDRASLTIENSTLLFSQFAKIIIEPGSELILDHTTFTNYEECYDPWLGVEVWGISTEHQYGYTGHDLAQGRLILKNQSYIKNATSAVELWNPGDWASTGGIVQAKDSYFINNAKAVHALYYHNYYPLVDPTEAEVDNVSFFKNCVFEVNSNYLVTQSKFNKHVDLAQVKGFNFEGCDFIISTSGDNISLWNSGIAAYDAGFSVKSLCTSIALPCTDYDDSNITGFYRGISAVSSETNPGSFYISQANFVNNNTGVYVSNVENGVIINSHFDIGPNIWAKTVCGDLISGFGIEMFNSVGFIIENNTFDKYELGPDDTYTGIRLVSCPSPHDIIYKNIFTGLSYGNYTEGTNRDDPGDDKSGVEYRCNENYSNTNDFIVENIYDDPIIPGMIRVDQGNPELAAANRFSQESSNMMHFINMGTHEVKFMYNENDPDYLIPDKDKISEYVQAVTNEEIQVNLCPDHNGGSGGSIKLSLPARADKELEFANNLADYTAVLSLYESLKDGGNTTSELLDIETATPDQTLELRNQLLGDSPHLSQEVLMAMSDRTDVLSNDIIFEILSANPDELQQDTLIRYLENKDDPLPDYMISILQQLAFTTTTYKTILLNDMDYYYGMKMQAAKSIIHSILSDTIIDQEDYRNWLDNMSCLSSDKQIVASYLSEDDTASALQLLSILPSVYNLSGDELADFNNYRDLLLLQLAWKNQGKTIVELDSVDLTILESYAYNTRGSASYSAKNILSAAYDYNFCDCLPSNDSITTKSVNASYTFQSDNPGLTIAAHPNPASTWVSFNFTLFSDESTGMIKLTDMNGKEITRFAISGKQGIKIWEIKDVLPGVYVYTITSLGSTKSGKLVIQ